MFKLDMRNVASFFISLGLMLAGNILLLVTLSLQAAEKTKNPKLVYSLLALGVILLFAGFVFAFLKRNLGFVFQFFNLVPMLTAVQNVSLPLVLDGVPARSADARAAALLDRVGLGGRAEYRPAELSGGQMQRVAVARALVARPALILADEPTGNLDSNSSTEVLELLRSLSTEDGAAVVMVTHDLAAARYGNRELHLVDGRACAAVREQ